MKEEDKMSQDTENTTTTIVENVTAGRKEKVSNIIQLEDGTSHDFQSKGMIAIEQINGEAAALKVKLLSGAVRQITLPDNSPLSKVFILRGMAEYIRNRCAGINRLELEDLTLSVEKAMDEILSGALSVKTEGAGGEGILIKAMMRLRAAAGKDRSDYESCKADVLKADPAINEARKKDPQFKAVIAQIRAEQAAERAKNLGLAASSSAGVVDSLI
jgi:hypothetical protein